MSAKFAVNTLIGPRVSQPIVFNERLEMPIWAAKRSSSCEQRNGGPYGAKPPLGFKRSPGKGLWEAKPQKKKKKKFILELKKKNKNKYKFANLKTRKKKVEI